MKQRKHERLKQNPRETERAMWEKNDSLCISETRERNGKKNRKVKKDLKF